MLCLFSQPQKELQLDLKTNKTQNCQKIELYVSLTTKDLKKPHSSRQVGRVEMTGQTGMGGEVWRPSVAQRGGGRMGGPTFTGGG